jgi:hypothetical protein
MKYHKVFKYFNNLPEVQVIEKFLLTKNQIPYLLKINMIQRIKISLVETFVMTIIFILIQLIY